MRVMILREWANSKNNVRLGYYYFFLNEKFKNKKIKKHNLIGGGVYIKT